VNQAVDLVGTLEHANLLLEVADPPHDAEERERALRVERF
jgi:hypothetical protein